MEIKIRPRRPPKGLAQKPANFIAELRASGFVPLGWLFVTVFRPFTAACFRNSDGTIGAVVYGRCWEGIFEFVDLDIISEFDSGKVLVTTSTVPAVSRPKLRIWKQRFLRASVTQYVRRHIGRMKRMGVPAPRALDLQSIGGLIREIAEREFSADLLRHWDGSIAVNPPEGCFLEDGSRTVGVVMENGKYIWGGQDIHDSGDYRIKEKTGDRCIISFHSDLGGGKTVEITRRGRKYVFRELAGGSEGKYTRPDGAEFLADSAIAKRNETKSWTRFIESAPTRRYLPVKETVEEFTDGDFLQKVRKEVIRMLAERRILKGKRQGKNWMVFDDGAFRAHMGYGIEEFVVNKQGWMFAAIRGPIDRVAQCLRKRPEVIAYERNVGASKLSKEDAFAGESENRQMFVLRVKESDWTAILASAHWFDPELGELARTLAVEVSKELSTASLVSWDDDFSGAQAVVFEKGKETERFSDEEDWASLYAMFYDRKFFLPECVIAADKSGVSLTATEPDRFERVDRITVKSSQSKHGRAPQIVHRA